MEKSDAWITLHGSMRSAILNDPTRMVLCPAHGTMLKPCVNVLAVDMSRAALAELVQICAEAAKGNDVSARAIRWIDDRCADHANSNESDLEAAHV